MSDTLRLFEIPHEKGHREWSAFSAVREDRAGGYRVALPNKPLVVKGPRHFLRIIPVRTFASGKGR